MTKFKKENLSTKEKLKSWFTANDSNFEDEDYEEIKENFEDKDTEEEITIEFTGDNTYNEHLEDEDYEEHLDDEQIENNKNSLFAKFKNIFSSKQKNIANKDKKSWFVEEDDEDIEETKTTEKETQENQNKEKRKNLFSNMNILKKIEDDFDNKDNYEDDEYDYEEELPKVEKNKKENSFLNKFKEIFKSEQYTNRKDIIEEDDEYNDEPEDYKTYLEKQKNIANKDKKSWFTKENNEEEIEEKTPVEEIATDSKEYDDFETEFQHFKNDKEEGIEEDEFNDMRSVKETSKVENIKNKINNLLSTKKQNKAEEIEEKEVDEATQNNTTEEELVYIEEKDKETTQNDIILEKLATLGVEYNEIKDVDIFEETLERRTHPTLASMKVKRILQDKNIENLTTQLVFEDGKQTLKKQVLKDNTANEDNKKENSEITRTSKNKEEREILDNDFNKITRKEEKISVSSNYLPKEKNTTIDKIIDELKEQNNKQTTDDSKYDIHINKEEKNHKDRREKLKYTTVDEVLKDNEEFLKDDIDRVAEKLVVERNIEDTSSEIENFRKYTLEEKEVAEVNPEKQTKLDKLILENNIKDNPSDETTLEISKLEQNLEIIKKEKELQIDELEKDENYEEDFTAIDGYSDYLLDEEEIKQLSNSYYDEKSIEKNNSKNTFSNDIDKFIEEKTYTPKKKETILENTIKNTEDKKEKIEYVEKLYTNDVKEYFVDKSSTKISFGEYKTEDYGYRPVSKDVIENNQRKLEEIFEKYSNTTIPKAHKNTSANNNEVISEKISKPSITNVGKFKPSVVYSSIYGASIPKTESKKNESKVESQTENNSSQEKIDIKKEIKEKQKNLYKEIASQNESVWNISLSNRVPKIKNKKTRK